MPVETQGRLESVQIKLTGKDLHNSQIECTFVDTIRIV